MTERLINIIMCILIEEGQKDYKKFKLGEIIKYSPTEVKDILMNHKDELENIILGVGSVIDKRSSKHSFTYASAIPAPCKACGNHPSNGGSGTCNCIIGTPVIY